MMKRIVLSAMLILLMPFTLAAKPAAKSRAKIRASQSSEQSVRQSVDAFNQKEVDACRNMDHQASAALWADDGVDLIPGLQPMIGKTSIAAWLNSLTPQLRGAKMEYCTIDWREIKIQGDWVYEWAITKQKIDFPPPQKSFENEGKMVLILKRQPDSSWKIELESWNSGPEADK
ncbi:MAG: YybH family protein [Candidatus Acidiferrales bacterium]